LVQWIRIQEKINGPTKRKDDKFSFYEELDVFSGRRPHKNYNAILK
jgi:hypothetical protein